jgi:O-antigen/teichoic acid export membrane protein
MKQLMYLGAVGAQAVASAALIPVLTHSLTAAEYGTVGVVVVIQQFITMFVGMGLPGMVTSWESGAETADLRRGAVLPVLALGAIGTAAAVAVQWVPLSLAVLVGSVNAVAALVLARVAGRGLAGVWSALTVAIGPLSIGIGACAAALTGSLDWYLAFWALGVVVSVGVALRWADADWFRSAPWSAVRRRAALSLPLTFSQVAVVALWSGDRLVVAGTLGAAALAAYQAAFTVGQLAASAGVALSNHWLPRLMRGETKARRNHLLSVTALALVGAVVAGPTLAVLLPSSYHPWSLWPVSAIAALSGIPQCLYVQLQARATYLGRTRSVGVGAFVLVPLAMGLTVLTAALTGSLVLIALVTPVSYLALAAHLWLSGATVLRSAVQPAAGGERNVLVVLSSIRWGYLWQRHQSLAMAAAETASVVFVESQPRRLRQLLTAPLHVLRQGGGADVSTPPPPEIRLVPPSPLAVIAPRTWARRQARLMLAEAGGRSIDVLLYAPSPAYLELARLLSAEGARVTYDAVIDWVLAPARFHPPRDVHRAEASLPASWRIVSDNPHVARDLETRLGRTIDVVPPAADEAFLAHVWPPAEARQPVVGWFGSIHAEVDVDLLCAASRAGVRVETVGPVEDADAAQQLLDAGVVMRPGVPIGALPATIEHWQVAILAYRGPRAATITPAKLLNALVGFQVAVRGIAVPEPLADSVVTLPGDDARAVDALASLVERPGRRGEPLQPEHLSWRGRLHEITGEASAPIGGR